MIEAKTDASQLPINQILCGDCIEVLKTLPAESINMVMFSPPYWGLRDYGIVGQIGLEEHPTKYIDRMVEICQQVKRLLLKSGSMYIVIGDTYFGGGQHTGTKSMGKLATPKVLKAFETTGEMIGFGYKNWNAMENSGWLQPKQLLGIPWRVAIALQEDGWILRNDIIWNKPNHMPSSVKDRLTNAYEHIFHFVKSRKYYYDLDAIREKHSTATMKRIAQPNVMNQTGGEKQDSLRGRPTKGNASRCNLMVQNIAKKYEGKFGGFKEDSEKFGSPRARNERVVNKVGMHHGSSLTKGRACHYEGQQIGDNLLGKNPSDVIKWANIPGQIQQGNLGHGGTHGNRFDHVLGKNPSDFWNINTKPFKGAHFAVYPETICVRPIKSSCPPDGIVLDVMCGSGTTLVVAKKLGRKYIGIELNPAYIEIANKRLAAIPEKITTFF